MQTLRIDWKNLFLLNYFIILIIKFIVHNWLSLRNDYFPDGFKMMLLVIYDFRYHIFIIGA